MIKQDLTTINAIIKIRRLLVEVNEFLNAKRTKYNIDIFDFDDNLEKVLTIEEQIDIKSKRDKISSHTAKLVSYIGEKEYRKLIYQDNSFNYEQDGEIKQYEPDMEEIKQGWYGLTADRNKLEYLGSTYYVVDEDIDKNKDKEEILRHDLINVNGSEYKVKKNIRYFIDYVIDNYDYNDIFEFESVKNDMYERTLLLSDPEKMSKLFSTDIYKLIQSEIFKDLKNGQFQLKIKHTL